MLQLKGRRFVECEIDIGRFQASLSSVVELFAGQVLNNRSDMSSSQEVRASSLVKANVIKKILKKQRWFLGRPTRAFSGAELLDAYLSSSLKQVFWYVTRPGRSPIFAVKQVSQISFSVSCSRA